MINFEYIDTIEKFQSIIPHLQEQTHIALDLECENNLHHYGVYISLIQLSTPTNHYILDILALQTLDPLKPILEDPNIQIIIHDFSFDLRILNHQFQARIQNLFDTQMAALLLGIEKIGLGNLLEEYFNIQKERKYQRVDWTQRPLSTDKLEYAIKDTAYLLQLKDILIKLLQEKKRLQWHTQECEYLESIDFNYHIQVYSDLTGFTHLSDKARAMLHVLFDIREQFAKKLDLPVFKIMGNKVMLEYASKPPRNWNHAKRVHPIIRKNAHHLNNLTHNTMQGPGEKLQRKPRKRMAKHLAEKVKVLTEKRNTIANQLTLRAHLIANNEQLRDIILTNTSNSLRAWQRDLLQS